MNQANKSSKFKGVCFNKQVKKWQAYIRFNGKLIHLGRYKSELVAAEAYDKKAVELFGEFANLNFPSQQSKSISEIKQTTHQNSSHGVRKVCSCA